MPFAGEFTAIYDDLIKPALEGGGYKVARADSFFDQQNILKDIVRNIGTADLIVADLTTLNPNVFYELGLCHGLRIPTILLTQSIEEVPFDLRGYRIHVYSTHFSEVHKLKASLQEISERHKSGDISFGSPVTDFLPSEAVQVVTATPELQEQMPTQMTEVASNEVEADKGWLDYLVEGDQAAEEISKLLQVFLDETTNIGSRIQSHSSRLETLAANPGPGSAIQARKIALLAASDMNVFSINVEDIAPAFEEGINTVTESFSLYANIINVISEEEATAVDNFRITVYGLLEGVKTGLQGTRFFRDAAAGLKGISKDINQASRRMTKTLNRIISSMEQLEAFCVRTLQVIDEKLDEQDMKDL